MAEVVKDILYPQKVWPPGLDQPVDMAPLVPHLHNRANEMLAAGLQIPLSWEHQSVAVPMTADEIERLRAEKARRVFGKTKGTFRNGAGTLLAKLSVEDPDDLRQMPKTGYCSPEIQWNFRDGTGKTWPGPSITHIAVTARPVQHHQQPFRLSLDGEVPPGQVLRLALADYQGDTDVNDDLEDTPPAGDGDGDGVPDVSDDSGKVDEIKECLARLGLVLPEDTTAENFLDRLHAAALTMEHHTQGDGAMGTDTVTGGAGGDGTPTPVQPPSPAMALSHEVQAQLERGQRAEANCLRLEREKLLGRIATLQARAQISKPVADELRSALTTVRLSLSTDGTLDSNDILTQVKAYERMPEGAAFGSTRLGFGGDPVPVPDPENEAQIEAQAQHLVKTTGGKLTIDEARTKVRQLMGIH